MENFTIYKEGKYDIKANAAMKLKDLSSKAITILDNAQTAFFVEHRIGRISLD